MSPNTTFSSDKDMEVNRKKQWSCGFSWADDDESDSDDEFEKPTKLTALLKSTSIGSIKSSTPPSSPSSSPMRVKSVRFAPLAEMRLIPSLPDLTAQIEGAKKPEMFIERNVRTVIL